MRLSIIIFLFSLLIGQQPDKILEGIKSRAKSLDVTDRKYGDHNGNRILNRFYNFGGIGDGGNLVSGVYPFGSGHSYFYEFTPVVTASVIDTNGNRVHIVSDGAVALKDNSPEGYQWGFEPLTGYANPNQEIMAMSDKSYTWPETWPNRDSDWDGYWNGQYGKYVRADQESYFVMDDYYNDEFAHFPDSADTDTVLPKRRSGLGVELEARVYQWNHPAAEDIIIVTYWITNVGTSRLDSVVFGMYGDADVGSTNGDFSDDDAWFDIENDIVYQWDHDGWSNASGGFKPVYFGWCFLESPGNPHDGIDNDTDGMIDESQFDGIDNDEDWLAVRDDIGSDGLGEYHYGYNGPDEDGTEGNGIPDLGEPNFEITDNDESDQIGLSSFYSSPYPSIYPSNDEIMWNQLKPGYFDVPSQNIDQTFLYGSGYIALEPGEKKKFSVAMVFGNDMDDILRNAVTMQNIYDNDYNFAKPPLKPNLTVVPGDRQVTLFWDKLAENSLDAIYGTDFEGYRVYRSTDPGFIDPYVITDTYGNNTFNKPIAQFDLIDSLKGPHPIGFNGIQYDMGSDTGLEHMYVDSNKVYNGMTYYYAVVAYDKGYDLDFYELGFSEQDNLLPIAPSECSIIVDLDRKGNVTNVSKNAGTVVPNAPVAGYMGPNTAAPGQEFVVHDSGLATGKIEVVTVDPTAVPEDAEYTLSFGTEFGTPIIYYSVRDEQLKTEKFVIASGYGSLEYNNIDSATVVISDESGATTYQLGIDYTLDYTNGIIVVTEGSALEEMNTYVASYLYYPILNSSSTAGETNNPIFDGMKIYLFDENIGVNVDSTGWIGANAPYCYKIFDQRVHPADFEIIWEGDVGDSITADYSNLPSPFRVRNITEDNEVTFRIYDMNHNDQWEPDEPILFMPYPGIQTPYMFVQFFPDSVICPYNEDDLLYEYDTTATIAKGDRFRITTTRPFTSDDKYHFTTKKSWVDNVLAADELDDIAVVPNPYVVTARWEPKHIYVSGRGPRKLDFINLPQECTIKIFTMAGYLIDEIEHTSEYEYGTHSWDMLSKDGLEIAYGLYIYHVDAPNVGEKTGKFAIIK